MPVFVNIILIDLGAVIALYGPVALIFTWAMWPRGRHRNTKKNTGNRKNTDNTTEKSFINLDHLGLVTERSR